MDLKKVLYLLYEGIFHMLLSVGYIILLILYFPLDKSLERLSLLVLLMFVIRIDKCIVFVSMYFKKSVVEFETTIILSLIYLLNSLEVTSEENYESNFLSTFTKIMFYSVLILNVLAYIYSFLLIFLFGIVILVYVLRGGQNNFGVNLDNRGLTEAQINSIEERPFSEIKQQLNQINESQIHINLGEPNENNNQNNANIRENDKVCSICLCEFADHEIISKLPKCNHIFHRECIREWLLRNHICPFCRNDIKRALRRQKRQVLQQQQAD